MDRDLWLAKIWDEWLTSPVTSRRNADAEASGLLTGMRHKSGTFTTNRLRAARRLSGPAKFPLWPLTSYSRKFPLSVSMITRPNHKPSVKFSLPPVKLTVPEKASDTWPWLKGLWGAAGGLYFPKSGYYLALIVSDPEASSLTRAILAKTGLAWSVHRSGFSLRNHDDITTFLYNIGIEAGALDFEGMTLIRSARNKANLERNYDAANIARSVRAAGEQSRLAEEIVSSGMLEALPEKLREVVCVRLANPDISLEELGMRLSPPVSKSTVKYRWSRIQSIAEKI